MIQQQPVVSTDVGVAGELLDGDLRAYIVNGDQAQAVADAMAHAMANRAEVGTELTKRYAVSYTRERMTEAYLTFVADCRADRTDPPLTACGAERADGSAMLPEERGVYHAG